MHLKFTFAVTTAPMVVGGRVWQQAENNGKRTNPPGNASVDAQFRRRPGGWRNL